jgi:N-acetylneuraminic acid mutarotase
MTASQAAHTETLLASGEVLTTGGTTCDAAGGNCVVIATTQRYDPVSGTWSASGDLTTPRVNHTATLLATGTVLVTGGDASGNPFESTELYDPNAGTWSPAGSMDFTREFHTATLLSDGRKVLVAGGIGGEPGGASSDLDNAEVYLPTKDKWRSAAKNTMSVARASHTATLLLDDSVLVAGGQLGNDSVANADLYLPKRFDDDGDDELGPLSQE